MKARQIITYALSQTNQKFGRILVVTGARQTGKTTLVMNGFSKYRYISIEDPIARMEYAKLTSTQWKTLYPKAALDEVQKEPSLIESIKSVYDQWTDTKYILLGSSQLLLMKQVKESLAGRCVIMELFPLTLPELKTQDWLDTVEPSLFQKVMTDVNVVNDFLPSAILDPEYAAKQKSWTHYLTFGAYPALTEELLTDDEKFVWLRNYVRTYLERDVRDLASFRDLEPFVKLQRAMAIRTGKLFNASDVGKDIGVTTKTVQRYVQYLSMSYQTIILPAWDRNMNKRLVKSPKIHYLDNGVLQAVLQKKGGITGHEYESLVIAEIYKQAKNSMLDARFFHLRTADGKEVDLLIEQPQGYLAFEIKMTEHVSKTDARHLLDLNNLLDKPLIKGFVLSNDTTTQQLSDSVVAVNAAMFLG